MESLKTLLIANRGEISVRILKTAKALNIRTIAVYTEPDAASTHVRLADEAILLSGSPSKAYIDGDQIIEIAKQRHVDAVIPGYGFLSENSEFARAVASAGMAFAGPSPESIEAFGLKHTARELATKAGVPIVPGSQGLVTSEEEAVTIAQSLGFPVMLKATAGGGGMGLLTCNTEKEVRDSFQTVQSRGEALFKNAGLFIERYYPSSHHIEVQVFGNGQGKAIAIGERECSIQRRHQKVIEECPSPFVTRNPELRKGLCDAAVRLAESINYGSAGTIEYLVDDESGSFFFLEMNTRLQVEHGITELCYGVDLVELMLKQADAQLSGKKGLHAEFLSSIPVNAPNGAAIEARVYAENPVRDFAPCPGTLQSVEWKEIPGSRIDTWVYRGIKVSANYDPLIAKVMYHGPDRKQAIEGLRDILTGSQICGPPTNLGFLAEILANEDFNRGNTLTKFLNTFKYNLSAIDVVSGGAYTLVQDWPGRPTIGKGFCHSGPMDSFAFRIANALVGNPVGLEGLEITLSGPELRFLGPALISLCGAPIDATLDDVPVPMWSRVRVSAGQRLKVGKTTGNGCRAYLAVFGGFLNIAKWFGSKATAPMVGVGGYQGRQLTSGDYISVTDQLPEVSGELSLPKHLIPQYPDSWELMSMPGPYDVGYFVPESLDMLYEAEWTVSHNAARGGVRLLGPRPKWARPDGGEGGSHPSNLIEYGYAIGSLNWTGDDPVIFPQDAPDLGGFVSSHTIVKGDLWKLGQVKAGDKLKFRATSLADALSTRNKLEKFVNDIVQCCQRNTGFDDVTPLDSAFPPAVAAKTRGSGIVHQIQEQGNQPKAGDDYLLIDYGVGAFDLNHRYRVTALKKALSEAKGDITFATGLTSMVGCGNSLMLYYDGTKVPQKNLIAHLCAIETQLGDLSRAKMPSRVFKLPITFNSKRQTAALQRYTETQRPYAAYLPDNMDFVAKNNAFTRAEFENIYLTASFLVITVGFFTALPIALPVDPRQRMNCPKMNPSRVFTPAGQVSWGGSCLAIYTVDSPGGYQMTGMTIPGVDILGSKKGYAPERPWLFEDFDQITFYKVDEEEYERQLALFQSGRYEYEWEEVEFDMAEHNRLLAETKDEVVAIRARQREAQREMDELEKELLERWAREKAEKGVPVDTVDALLKDPQISPIEAPLNANVWKVEVKEGDKLDTDQVVVILEAMKLEIAVRSEASVVGSVVEKILVQQGDSIEAGKPLMLVRRAEK
ncbi:Putative Acetyl-/propionyl-coenzyme A carboxylase alpha chain [Aspergillus calidoustus]|uniref:Putative Acetyl-/propionyl-coenzyme A carboxylase alpha chain n=1 Tax=Aspergillus calidoustus TaxID=454130 RepID=A0A0U5GTF2_ASPCI|nr:Putative Acetyl-/propionyl-coenzyme A carboxylase alpha chain [Aspergillus calidoustus]